MSRGEIVRAVLGTVAVVGILPLLMVAPGVAKASMLFSSRPPRVQRRTADRVLRRLEDRGLVRVFVKEDGAEYVSLTEKGKTEVFRYELGRQRLAQTKWDQLWRIVVFDVHEKRGPLRRRLRISLHSFGFVRLQNSVWIYPYECEEIIELVRTMLRLRGEVIYLLCARFRGDQWLCDRFQLLPQGIKK